MINERALRSDTMALKVLRALHPDSPPNTLYEKAESIAACVRQACSFDAAAGLASIEVSPLLRYYSLLHWMKACLHLYDLQYPSSTSVLQHGLSVRRLKKENYKWTLDYVHVYKEGVFQSFGTLFEESFSPPARFVIADLLGSLPRTAEVLAKLSAKHQHVYLVTRGVDGPDLVPRRIASNIGLTIEEWLHKFAHAGGRGVENGGTTVDHRVPEGMLALPWNANGVHSGLPSHPWIVESMQHDGRDQFWIQDGAAYPAWAVHYVLLYSLSTICRYNPVEWSQILLWNSDSDGFLARLYLEECSTSFHLLPLTKAMATLQ